MSTTSQISHPAFDYRHQGFSVKILELERDAYPLGILNLVLLGASVNNNKYIFLVDLVAHFLKLYVGCMRKWGVAMKIVASEIGF
jgi:hypothetical protein